MCSKCVIFQGPRHAGLSIRWNCMYGPLESLWDYKSTLRLTELKSLNVFEAWLKPLLEGVVIQTDSDIPNGHIDTHVYSSIYF